MAKLIVALHEGWETARVSDSAVRAALADVGATRFQLNLDDEAVAPALRFGPGERIVALVSVWTTGDVRGAFDVLTHSSPAGTCDAYRVTERVRLDPAPTTAGVRADVLAQIALLRRPDSMTREAYLDYWLGQHTAIAIRTQNTSAYVQNIVEETLTPSSPPIVAIVEEHFPMAALTDVHAFYGSRGDDAELERRMAELMTSVATFGADRDLDLVPTSCYAWDLG